MADGITRALIRQNSCPKCGAAPGDPCHGVGPDRRPRVANHAERRGAAKAAKARRAASYGRGGAGIWNRVTYQLGYDAAPLVGELCERRDIIALESEIERAFAVYCIARFALIEKTALTVGLLQEYPDGFVLVPQFATGPYRVDFVFAVSKRLELRDCLVIELDGHEWHEKTKEQVARDKARDRYLSRTFGRVIHFTGSEIYGDVASCFAEMLQVYTAMMRLDFP